jgi:hypothetical protein
MKILFAVTHISAKLGLRQLTFANQGRNHHSEFVAAQSALDAYKPSLISAKILTPEEAQTMEVRPVQCFDHGDAMGIYFD